MRVVRRIRLISTMSHYATPTHAERSEKKIIKQQFLPFITGITRVGQEPCVKTVYH